MRSLTLLAASVAALLLASPAFASLADDSAYDKNSKPVYDSQGDCVRTKWQGDTDPCAPPPPPPIPKPVAKPVPAPAPEPMPVVSLEQRTIYFDFDKADITPDAAVKLEELAKIVNDSKAIADVRVHGFTDQFGSDDYNLILASKRAAAVKDYLDGRSRLAATLAEVKGLGKSSPEAGCEATNGRDAKIACMAKERRVEIEFKSEK